MLLSQIHPLVASEVKTKPPTVKFAVYVLLSNSFAVKEVAWTNSTGGSTLEEEELLELEEEELSEETEELVDELLEELSEELVEELLEEPSEEDEEEAS